jgi:transposase
MVPTLVRTWARKGQRPTIGTKDNKDVVFAFASLNVVSGRLVTRLLPISQAQRRREGSHKTKRLQAMFARHLRDVARTYPAATCPRVVITIDNAPWHWGEPIREVLRQHPHLELYRLPSYSPQLNVIERLWKLLRRRATHNRLFEEVRELCGALRASLRYLQVMERRVLSLIHSPRRRPKSAAA